MAANLAIHGAHNASLAVEKDGNFVCVVEFERWMLNKNCGFTAMYPVTNVQNYIVYEILDYIKSEFGIEEYENCWYQDADINMFKDIRCKNFVDTSHLGKHHSYHASGTFYQSDFEKAIVISFDGGAPDGYFHIYKIERGGDPILLKAVNIDLGSNYGYLGSVLGDIKASKKCNLVYAGKVMGLQSYGNVIEAWKPELRSYFMNVPWWRDVDARLASMIKEFALSPNDQGQILGQAAWDFAATGQSVFEDLTFENVDDTLQSHPDYPICITGGCALNILFNTKLKEKYQRKVFVAPNSSDCGLTVGMLAAHAKPDNPWDVTYGGTELLDKNMIMRYVDTKPGVKANVDEIVNDLVSGKILGFVQGRSEHGPRALGNRSILCNPIGTDVKDTLNFKVKHREWYRPFAPIVRLEDVSKYFDWDGETRWMNFCPTVKTEYLNRIPAITHVDNTARVQTITKEQNPLLYDILGSFGEKTGIAVLLNTSFNVDGKPILSSITEAFEVFEKTQLDRLYINGYYFRK